MKSVFKYAITVSLLLGVFSSSVGITVFRHICHSAKSSKVSLFKIESCCGEELPCAWETVRCCETQFTWAKTTIDKRVEKRFSILTLFELDNFLSAWNNFPARMIFPENLFSQIEKPPPLSGFQIILLNQVFRS